LGGKLQEAAVTSYHLTIKPDSPLVKPVDEKNSPLTLGTFFTVAKLQSFSSGAYEGKVEGDVVTTVVKDDGRGFDVDQVLGSRHIGERLGLMGMEERVVFAKGTLAIESQPGEGTCVVVTHGGPIRMFLLSALRASPPRPWR